MKSPPHTLRMRVQRCSVGLHAGETPRRLTVPWAGRDYVVFRGTMAIRSFADRVSEVALHSGTMLVYAAAPRKSGGFIEVDYSEASEDRGFFGVSPEAFDRVLAIAIAHLSGHQSGLELQFHLLRYSKGRARISLTQMWLSYGERFYFSEE